MDNIKIKDETLPQRCDICHQADCFDASTNYCSRCGKAANLIKSENQSPKPAGKITIELKLEPSDFTRAQQSLVANRTIKRILFWIIIIGGALFLYTAFSSSGTSIPSPPAEPTEQGPSSGLAAVLTYAPIIMFILFWIFMMYFLKKNQTQIINKNFKSEFENMRCTFSNDGYELSSDKTYFQTKWETLTRVAETDKYFVFFTNGIQKLIIPKRLFNNQHEIVILRDIIKSSLGKKAELKNI